MLYRLVLWRMVDLKSKVSIYLILIVYNTSYERRITMLTPDTLRKGSKTELIRYAKKNIIKELKELRRQKNILKMLLSKNLKRMKELYY